MLQHLKHQNLQIFWDQPLNKEQVAKPEPGKN